VFFDQPLYVKIFLMIFGIIKGIPKKIGPKNWVWLLHQQQNSVNLL